MAKAEAFAFGEEKIPDWFNDEAKKGRVRVFYDDEKNVSYANIISGSKTYKVNVGDTIIKSNSGLVAVAKDKVKQYKVKNNDKQNTENNKEG